MVQPFYNVFIRKIYIISENASDPNSVSTCLNSLGSATRYYDCLIGDMVATVTADGFFQWHCDSLNASLSSIGSIRGIILFKVSL